nr:immunoglobulin heavy chain junction region [Macaca mulatta]MOW26047.1 immunoglobulin heavy chain junction region [Macaca mulatta]
CARLSKATGRFDCW